jgi:signal transduction histidine kinase/ABC-type uncharacterized transport system substrate-binding protein
VQRFLRQSLWKALGSSADTIALFLVFFLFLAFGSAGAQVKPIRRVLLLTDLGTPASPGFTEIKEAVFAGLQKSPYQIEFYDESLDLTLFSDQPSQRQIREALLRKYSDRRPDVIIAAGSESLTFATVSSERFFGDTPIVFCGVLGKTLASLNPNGHVTGVLGRLHPEETLNAALQMLPRTRHVVVVGGMGAFDAEWEAIAKEAFHDYESKLEFTYLFDLSMPDLLERLKSLPDDTIVYHTAITRDRVGSLFVDSAQSVPLVAGAANAPVFVMDDVDLRGGTIGGDLVNWADDGRVAAEMAVRILSGRRPEDISIVSSNDALIFDWNALERWGVKQTDIPRGSVVLNRPPGLWHLYKRYVLAGVLVLLGQTLAIVALLWQRARRRKAENELAISCGRLSMAVEAGKFVGWDWDIKAGTNQWFGDLNNMFGISSNRYSAEMGELSRRVSAEDRDTVSKAIETARRSRKPYFAEFRIAQGDGTVRWVIAKGQFYYANNGDAERMLGLAVDITDRKVAEEAVTSMSRRLIQAQEQERTRIARELHDDINQRLALLEIDLTKLRDCPPDSSSDLQENFEGIRSRLSDINSDIQAISHQLHSSKLEYLGLVTACKSLCKELSERHNFCIAFQSDGIPQSMPPSISLTLFRVLQECLHNAIKHSGAKRLTVQLWGVDGEVQLIVHDDGIGFNVNAAMTSTGLGLLSIRERLALVKGTLSITSEPISGTEIRVCVPMTDVTSAKAMVVSAQ